MEKSEIVDITIDGFEKRRDGGKHYVYRIKVKYASKKVDVIWRRYRQFDALKSTIDGMLATVKETEALPKLTPKKYIGRSSIRHVADVRKPRLQAFLTGVLEHAQNDPKMMTTLTFFLTPTTADKGAKLVSATGGDDSDSDADDGSHGAELQGVVIQAHVDGRHQQALSAGAVVRVGADDLSHPFHRPDGVFVDARLPCGTRGLVRLSAVDLSEGAVERRMEAPVKSAAAELLSTEQAFVHELEEVRDRFFPKLRAILTAPEAKCFFSNWGELIAHSTQLLTALTADGADVAQVMCDMLPTLQVPYAKYCQGIPAAQELYEHKLHAKEFVRFEQSMPTLNKPTLNHIMRPVQRLMKYPLLLSEIKKERLRASANADTAVIEAALELAATLAHDANATMATPVGTLNPADISGPNEGSYVHVTSIIGSTTPADDTAAATPPSARSSLLQRLSRRGKHTPPADPPRGGALRGGAPRGGAQANVAAEAAARAAARGGAASTEASVPAQSTAPVPTPRSTVSPHQPGAETGTSRPPPPPRKAPPMGASPTRTKPPLLPKPNVTM
eukprot:m.214153 g.214153  ORF g.214153 m.214153 type:complete len:560 (-) comp19070_c0_seq6:315-1994(-)